MAEVRHLGRLTGFNQSSKADNAGVKVQSREMAT
jgi:hypothetical protein